MALSSIFTRLADRLRLSAEWRTILSNLSWAMTGKVVNLLGQLLVGVLIARYLGPEQFGLMNYVISFVTIFGIFSAFGLDFIEVRELSREPAARDRILGTTFLIRLGLSLLTIGAIAVTLRGFGSDFETSLLVLVYAMSLPFGAFNVIRNYFTSVLENEYVVKSEIFRTVLGALIKGGLLLLHGGLFWFILASAFDFVLVAGGYLTSYRRRVGSLRGWRFDRRLAGYLLCESFPLLLSGAAVIVYQKIDQVMIHRMIDNAAVGQYAAADKITELIMVLPTIVSQTVTPLLVRERERDPAVYEVKKQQFVGLVVWISILMALGVSVLAYVPVRLLYGTEYLAAVPVLRIMAWKAVGMALSASAGQLIIIEGIQRYAVYRNFGGCVVCVALNWLLIPRYGILGSAMVTLATLAFTGCLANLLIPPYYPILKVQLRALWSGWRELAALGAYYRRRAS